MEGNGVLTFFALRGPSKPTSHGQKPEYDGICHSSVELCGMLWTTGHIFILIAVDNS